MKLTLTYEREHSEGRIAFWCRVLDGDKVITGKYGSTLKEAREKAIADAKIKIESASNPIESEEIDL